MEEIVFIENLIENRFNQFIDWHTQVTSVSTTLVNPSNPPNNFDDAQSKLVQLALEKEISDAQNRAYQQQIYHFQQEIRQQEKSISALQEQLISCKEENKSLKENQSNTLAKDKQFNKFDTLFHSQQLEERMILQEMVEEIKSSFYSSDATTDHSEAKTKFSFANSLILEEDYRRKIHSINHLHKEKKGLEKELTMLKTNILSLREDKESLLSNIEASTITEQALYTANSKQETLLKEHIQKYENLQSLLRSEQEKNLLLSKQLRSSEISFHQTETELRKAVTELKEGLNRREKLIEERTISLLEREREKSPLKEQTQPSTGVDPQPKEIINNQGGSPLPVTEKSSVLLNVLKSINRRRFSSDTTTSEKTLNSMEDEIQSKNQPEKKQKLGPIPVNSEKSGGGRFCGHCGKSVIGVTIKCQSCQQQFHRYCWDKASYHLLDLSSNKDDNSSLLCKRCCNL